MTTYTDIPNIAIDPESPIDTSLMFSLRDNPTAITEGATGAPQYKGSAIVASSITDDKLGFLFPLYDFLISPEYTITPGAVNVFTHGRGKIPKFVQAQLLCTTAELGYTIGDEVLIDPSYHSAFQGGSALRAGGMSLRFYLNSMRMTISNIGFAKPFILLHKTAYTANQITNANWKIEVKLFW